MKRKTTYCNHFKSNKPSSFYAYKIVGKDILLCQLCEKKLREQILQQVKDEEEVREIING